ncbi:hypothetical protein EII29_10815 [Leptotrichia sp. OH3620_COT-345]|uniref:hypothetical protein n=1 Tax=Leptotrichia sp. OH3620_COT-345 TaxID=2491048 RepID=UPI000F64DD7E|nr:hypothetical protein [Leptotrichia sp. OH3620_COT-345]RRD37936.1 hypothetical protein EII29_10815 [Leptotrichia sp. OH3620_COT-345]
MKNCLKNLFIFFYLLVFSNISYGQNTLFKDFSEKIKQNIKENSMSYIKNQQCFTSYWNIIIKNFHVNHIKLFAVCVEVDPSKKINWDNPDIPENSKVKTVYIFGKDMTEKIRDELSKKKTGFFFKNLAFYKPSHPEYKEDEYYYFE